MRIAELIIEALDLENKKWIDEQLSELNYSPSQWDDIFGNEDRIYIPISPYQPNDDVVHALQDAGYFITDYQKGLAVESAKDIKMSLEKVLNKDKKTLKLYHDDPARTNKNLIPDPSVILKINKMNFELVDYQKGIVKKLSNPRVVKIGSILKNVIKDQSLLRKFETDPLVKNKSQAKQLVVISRNKYDVAEMSTGKKWESCLNLDTGSNAKYIPTDIAEGVIVAYLIDNDDIALDDPHARIAIKPFINEDDYTIAFGAHDRVYSKHGSYPEEFVDIVVNWVNSVNESRKLDGVFYLSKNVYNHNEFNSTIKRLGSAATTFDRYGSKWRNVPSAELNEDYLTSVVYNNPNMLVKLFSELPDKLLSSLVIKLADSLASFDEYSSILYVIKTDLLPSSENIKKLQPVINAFKYYFYIYLPDDQKTNVDTIKEYLSHSGSLSEVPLDTLPKNQQNKIIAFAVSKGIILLSDLDEKYFNYITVKNSLKRNAHNLSIIPHDTPRYMALAAYAIKKDPSCVKHLNDDISDKELNELIMDVLVHYYHSVLGSFNSQVLYDNLSEKHRTKFVCQAIFYSLLKNGRFGSSFSVLAKNQNSWNKTNASMYLQVTRDVSAIPKEYVTEDLLIKYIENGGSPHYASIKPYITKNIQVALVKKWYGNIALFPQSNELQMLATQSLLSMYSTPAWQQIYSGTKIIYNDPVNKFLDLLTRPVSNEIFELIERTIPNIIINRHNRSVSLNQYKIDFDKIKKNPRHINTVLSTQPYYAELANYAVIKEPSLINNQDVNNAIDESTALELVQTNPKLYHKLTLAMQKKIKQNDQPLP